MSDSYETTVTSKILQICREHAAKSKRDVLVRELLDPNMNLDRVLGLIHSSMRDEPDFEVQRRLAHTGLNILSCARRYGLSAATIWLHRTYLLRLAAESNYRLGRYAHARALLVRVLSGLSRANSFVLTIEQKQGLRQLHLDCRKFLACTYRDLGEWHLAVDLLQENLAQIKSEEGDESWGVWEYLHLLGSTYESAHNVVLTEKYYTEAYTFSKARYEVNPLAFIASSNGLADAIHLRYRKEHGSNSNFSREVGDRIVSILEDAARVVENYINNEKKEQVNAQIQKSEVFIRLAMWEMGFGEETAADRGLSRLRTVCQIRKKILGESPELALAYTTLGNALRYIGRYEESLEYIDKAVATRRLSTPFSPPLAELLQNAAQAYLEGGNHDQALLFLREAWLIVTSDATNTSMQYAGNFMNYCQLIKDMYMTELLRRGFRDEILVLMEEHRALFFQGSTRRDSINTKSRRLAEGRITRGRRTLNKAGTSEWKRNRRLQSTSVRACLPDNTILLVYNDNANTPFVRCFSCSSDELVPLQSQLSIENLKEECRERRSDLLLKGGKSKFADTDRYMEAQPEAWKRLGSDLGQALIPPQIQEKVRCAKHVIICPDVHLWSIFFPLIRLKNGYLGQTHALSQIHSLLSIFRDQVSNSKENRSLVLSAGTNLFKGIKHSPSGQISESSISRFSYRDAKKLKPLNHAASEATGVAAFYKPYADSLINREFVEEAIKERAKLANLIHLSSHGFWEPVTEVSSGRAGVFTYDKARVDHQQLTDEGSTAKLIVFSACNAGHGDETAGVGLLNCVYHLIMSGCRTCIASGIPVEDESCKKIMVRFHRDFAQNRFSVAEAFRSALAKINTPPVYWVGLTVFGDGNLKVSDILPLP